MVTLSNLWLLELILNNAPLLERRLEGIPPILSCTQMILSFKKKRLYPTGYSPFFKKRQC